MSIEITSDDHLVKEKAHLDKKEYWFYTVVMERILKELTHDFGQKMEILSLIVFGHIRPGNIVWWSSSKNKSPPRLQKYEFYIDAILDFSKELTYDFGQNLKFPLCLFLDKMAASSC